MHQRLSEQVILIAWLWMKKIFLLVHLYFVHLYYEQNSVLSSSTPCLQHPSITSRFKHLVFLHPDHLFHPASIILALIDISFALERQFDRQPVDIDIREERSMLWKPGETKLFIGSAGGGNNALFVFLPSYNNLWVPFTILAKTTTTMFILFLPDLYYHKPFCTLFSSINPSAMFVCLETFDWCSAIFESFLCCWLSAIVKKTLAFSLPPPNKLHVNIISSHPRPCYTQQSTNISAIIFASDTLSPRQAFVSHVSLLCGELLPSKTVLCHNHPLPAS